MAACYRPSVEIDGPAAEEPVIGTDGVESMSNSIESLKLFIGDGAQACDSRSSAPLLTTAECGLRPACANVTRRAGTIQWCESVSARSGRCTAPFARPWSSRSPLPVARHRSDPGVPRQ